MVCGEDQLKDFNLLAALAACVAICLNYKLEVALNLTVQNMCLLDTALCDSHSLEGAVEVNVGRKVVAWILGRNWWCLDIQVVNWPNLVKHNTYV